MNEQQPGLKPGILTLTDFFKIALAVLVGVILAVALLNALDEEWANLPVAPAETS